MHDISDKSLEEQVQMQGSVCLVFFFFFYWGEKENELGETVKEWR